MVMEEVEAERAVCPCDVLGVCREGEEKWKEMVKFYGLSQRSREVMVNGDELLCIHVVVNIKNQKKKHIFLLFF